MRRKYLLRDLRKFKRNWNKLKSTQSIHRLTSTILKQISLGRHLANVKSRLNPSIIERKCSNSPNRPTNNLMPYKLTSIHTSECGRPLLNSTFRNKKPLTAHCLKTTFPNFKSPLTRNTWNKHLNWSNNSTIYPTKLLPIFLMPWKRTFKSSDKPYGSLSYLQLKLWSRNNIIGRKFLMHVG